MTIIAKEVINKNNNQPNYEVNTFWINTEAQDKSIQFRPAKMFNDVDIPTVLAIITGANLKEVSKANNQGNINFTLSKPDREGNYRTFGYLNNVESDLTVDSSADMTKDVIKSVTKLLSAVTVDDITQPMTRSDADYLLSTL